MSLRVAGATVKGVVSSRSSRPRSSWRTRPRRSRRRCRSTKRKKKSAALSPLASDFLFDPPEYASEYHPLPRRMKLPEVISREADSALQLGQVLMASSVMRWTRSNSWPQAPQR